MDLTSAWISAIAGIVGTLLGACIAWFASKRQRRLETVRDMHREFNAPDFTRSRGPAGDTVRRHSRKNYQQMRSELPSEEMQHVWNVMYFYQRLWLAIDYKHVRTDQVPGMFGENFYWWWINSYATQLAPKDGKGGPDATSPPTVDWQAAREISDLKRWIDRKTKRDKKLGKKELDLWTDRAKRLGGPVPEETVKVATSRRPVGRRKLRGATRCYPV